MSLHFVKIWENVKILIECLYVDDLRFMGNNSDMFSDFNKSMMDEFVMSNLGKMHYFLDLEVKQSDNSIFVFQTKYVQEILSRFNMQNRLKRHLHHLHYLTTSSPSSIFLSL